jgi:hypothetical protein
VLNEPIEVYNDFVEAICLPLLDNIQSNPFPTLTLLLLDHLKPEVCTFMAVYVIRELRKQYQAEDSKQAMVLADQFCMEARDAAKQKMLFISELLKVPSDKLEDKCNARLTSPEGKINLNKWFLPSMPNIYLGPKDSCKAVFDLFSSMTKAPSFFKAVQFSMVLMLELDYNSRETNIFNECIDSYVRQDPKLYCLH